MDIEAICIATHKLDLPLTRICVGSIRYFYPDLPIYLINDYTNGDYSTREFRLYWGVADYPCPTRCFGWGLSKLEPLLERDRRRVVILDSDIAFVGPVLDVFAAPEADFVVHGERQPEERLRAIYFNTLALREWDPEFRIPPYTFNTGQYLATTGLLRREDFQNLVDWESSPPTPRHPQIFKNADQGLLNYVIFKKADAGALTVSSATVMLWGAEELGALSLDRIRSDSPYPRLIHWAGMRCRRIRHMLRSDILAFFQDYYYSRIPGRRTRQCLREISVALDYATMYSRRRWRAACRRLVQNATGDRRLS